MVLQLLQITSGLSLKNLIYIILFLIFFSCEFDAYDTSCKSCSNSKLKANHLFYLNRFLNYDDTFFSDKNTIKCGEGFIQHKNDIYWAYTNNNSNMVLVKNFTDTLFKSSGSALDYSDFFPKFNGRIINNTLVYLTYPGKTNTQTKFDLNGPGLLLIDLFNNETEFYKLPESNYFSFFYFKNKIYLINKKYKVAEVYLSLESKSLDSNFSESVIEKGDKILSVIPNKNGDYVLRSIDDAFTHELISLEEERVVINDLQFGVASSISFSDDSLFILNSSSGSGVDIFSILTGEKIGKINSDVSYIQANDMWFANGKIFIDYDTQIPQRRVREKLNIKIIDIKSKRIEDFELLLTNPTGCDYPDLKDIIFYNGKFYLTGNIKCLEINS